MRKVACINPKTNIPDNFKYVDLESVVGTSLIKAKLTTKQLAPSRAQRVAKKGDIFYQTVRPYQKNNFLFDINNYDFQYVFSTGYAQLRSEINNYFLFSYLQRQRFVNLILRRSTGTSYPAISSKDLSEIKIIFPRNSKEQENIGKIINLIDALITLQQRKLEQLKQLKKALLQQLFVGKNNKQPNLRFKNFDGEWEQCMLKEIKDVRDGTHNSPKYQKEGYPLVTSKNLITNGIDLSNVSFISKYDYQEINKRSKVETGDILFGMIGTIGNPVMVKKGGFAIKNVALIKNGGEVSNGFLLHLLKSAIFSQYIKKENAGGTQKFLGLSVIRGFKFKVPDKVEQGNIASIFDTLNRFITLQKNNLTQLTTLKKYLLQNLFI
ncbi:restriction endonuclease subunit S [Lactobacillus reuteri]|uniref:restriction endonuclease subunit S n=1 Tax=Limosilactobacillus reuteri TaxID=1598 RepID=UPI0016520235|nr:restriction endonuclease subunit S [Limosilactobacillus reuteri]MBC6910364.1 restriction endonuclease subunit S [Limosilactobacillus reuteri]MCC4491426.1 restriction endonuclease subunit S [Limosilactobacillus reuteri]